MLWLFFVGALALRSILFPYHLPFAASNGTYVNPCCEKVTLADGKMLVGGKLVADYVIDRGNGDPYIAPRARIMIVTTGISVEKDRNPLFLNFVWKGKSAPNDGKNSRTSWIDETTRPVGFEITGVVGTPYLFTRE